MKIASVGKGGAGKTTISCLLSQYLSKEEKSLAIDGDINMHMSFLLSERKPQKEDFLSLPKNADKIKEKLRGNNLRIKSNAEFKKSTPPAKGSNILNFDSESWFLNDFSEKINDNLYLSTVGCYTDDGLASSCYHNNLAILENILSHTNKGNVLVDMVAGTDAFASTLFAHFDALIFAVEPTKRSIEVLKDYVNLAKAGGVDDRLVVVGNKVEDEDDEGFIKDNVSVKFAGSISRSKHLLKVDKGREKLDVDKMSKSDIKVLENVIDMTKSIETSSREKLKKLWDLHKTYVSQKYVMDRHGDLTCQIDEDFSYDE